MLARRAALALVLFGVACSKGFTTVPPEDAGPVEDPRFCPFYAETPVRVGSVVDALGELSGTSASRKHAGIYWAHNDSGNAFELFAMRENGEVAARYLLTGATPVDLEAIALAPCAPGGAQDCLFLADVGDNLRARQSVAIYKLPEPATIVDATLPVEVLRYTYPDGPVNVEALIAETSTSKLYVISKYGEGLGEVFRLDGLSPTAQGSAVRVRTLSAKDHTTTAGDVHPSGLRVILRTYGNTWEYRNPDAGSLEEVFDGRLVEVASAQEQFQAESVSYLPDGRGYLLGTEGSGGGLFKVGCR